MQLTLINKLTELNRITKQLIMMLFDSMCIVLALIISFSINKGFLYRPVDELFWLIFGAPVIAIPVFLSFRLYRSVIRYI